jgi:nitrite reductase/ring-hydroxylating ferredoxin subunit
MSETTRRQVLAGAAGASATLVLAACARGEQSPTPPNQPAAAAPPHPVKFAQTSDIPVNSGKIFPDQNVVVTQPVAGEFKAFSATCPHKGCALAGVQAASIMCKCHGSTFNVADGSVTKGPATSPLRPMAITVDAGNISLLI